jgi:hypothetical protein
MIQAFPLAPRYRLDDETPWLEGIDPSRQYWIMVNGEATLITAVAGLTVASMAEFRTAILSFREMQPGDRLSFYRPASACVIHCIGQNCYAVEGEVEGAPVWHLFDQETLDSLLMTSHPDWQCSAKDMELGRRMLARSLQKAIAA